MAGLIRNFKLKKCIKNPLPLLFISPLIQRVKKRHPKNKSLTSANNADLYPLVLTGSLKIFVLALNQEGVSNTSADYVKTINLFMRLQ